MIKTRKTLSVLLAIVAGFTVLWSISLGALAIYIALAIWVWPRRNRMTGELKSDGRGWAIAKVSMAGIALAVAGLELGDRIEHATRVADCAPIRDEVATVTSRDPSIEEALKAADFVLENQRCFNGDDIADVRQFKREVGR